MFNIRYTVRTHPAINVIECIRINYNRYKHLFTIVRRNIHTIITVNYNNILEELPDCARENRYCLINNYTYITNYRRNMYR